MIRKRTRFAGIVVAAVVAYSAFAAAPAGAAATYTPLTPSDPSRSQRLGAAVAQSTDGLVTVVGSIFREVGTTYVPSVAYVYVGVTGSNGITQTETAQLVRTEGIGSTDNDQFGSSVDVSADGDTIAVSAPTFVTGGGGAVFIFERTGPSSWAQSAQLNAPAGAALAAFGGSISLSDDGTRLLVGSSALSTAAQGSATYFSLEGQTWTQKSVVYGGSASALGGASVAMSADGTRAAVGAPQYRAPGATSNSGRVYIYTVTANAMSLTSTLADPSTATTVTTGANFGSGALSFTADNNGLLVGAQHATTASGSTVGGMAYLYQYATTWTRSATFSVPTSSTARLGFSGGISPDGTRIVLGAPAMSGGGRAYASIKSGGLWGTLTAIGPLPNSTTANMGYAATFGSNSRVVIGAPMQRNAENILSGQAWVIDLS